MCVNKMERERKKSAGTCSVHATQRHRRQGYGTDYKHHTRIGLTIEHSPGHRSPKKTCSCWFLDHASKRL
jgi:hypothetical protein